MTPMSSVPAPESPDQENAAPKGAMLTIFSIVLVDMLGFGLIIPLLPLYARDFGATAPQVTLLFAIFSICQFIATPILGAWSDRIGRRPILLLSLLGNACGYALLAWATQHSWTNLALGLWVLYLARIIAGLTAGKHLRRTGLHQRHHHHRQANQRHGRAGRGLWHRLLHWPGARRLRSALHRRLGPGVDRRRHGRRRRHPLLASPAGGARPPAPPRPTTSISSALPRSSPTRC